MRRREHLVDPHSARGLTEPRSIAVIAITEEIPRCSIPGERVAQLLGGPLRGRMGRDRDMHGPAAIVGQYHKDKQDSEQGRWYNEEVSRDEIGRVVPQERVPGLGGRPAMTDHVRGDRGLGHINAEFQ
jgi:hypothetical protein